MTLASALCCLGSLGFVVAVGKRPTNRVQGRADRCVLHVPPASVFTFPLCCGETSRSWVVQLRRCFLDFALVHVSLVLLSLESTWLLFVCCRPAMQSLPQPLVSQKETVATVGNSSSRLRCPGSSGVTRSVEPTPSVHKDVSSACAHGQRD